MADADIQTTSFNVFPRYDYIERTQVLAGYRVSNSVSIKIRDLDRVGEIIDDVASDGLIEQDDDFRSRPRRQREHDPRAVVLGKQVEGLCQVRRAGLGQDPGERRIVLAL